AARRGRDVYPGMGPVAQPAPGHLPGVLHAGRDRGAVLAPRRPGLDLPVPLAVPGGMMSHAPTGHAESHAAHDDGRVHAHISGFGFLCAIFATLIVLTIITVAVSYVDLGSANTVVAIVVATIKASLVALFFMHLRHDKAFHGFVFVIAFVFLSLFL